MLTRSETVSINSFHIMRMRAVKSLVSFMFIQGLHYLRLHFIHLTSKQGLLVKISGKIH